MRNLRRWLWLIPIVIIVVCGLAVAAGPSLGPLADQAVSGAGPEACSPSPCAAPHGFEADISNLVVAGGRLSMNVTFHNRTSNRNRAVSFNHTSPADFQLRMRTRQQLKPIFDNECPQWSELRIARGADAGPETLCFQATSLSGAQLVWSPDLGLLFDDVRIPLG
ncbi:MAG: hypothetical protein M3Z13_02525 [Candidatus Dormibacteraeota bacterium]|nr:hypothetical protein [Candidatus Dormibacteraeota bacterium]